MSEADVIERTDEPVTVSSLLSDLRALGVEAGDTLLVHASLSSLGWVSGGAQAVLEALMRAISRSGTVVMPTFTGQLSDPADWNNPPIPEEWIPTIHQTRPAFRPQVTPTRGVGAVAECFRTYPDAIRSRHPEYSLAAWGAEAERVIDEHSLEAGLGPESPLGRIYELDGDVLRLGTSHETNTSFHLAEYRADIPSGTQTHRAPLRRDGERVMVEYDILDIDASDFADLGADYEREMGSRTGSVGLATAGLASQRSLVNYAEEWLEQHR